jgi:hypothetical protein
MVNVCLPFSVPIGYRHAIVHDHNGMLQSKTSALQA